MSVHLPSLSPVHVLYPHVDSQCQRQCSDMNVVALMPHWLNLLEGTVMGWEAYVVTFCMSCSSCVHVCVCVCMCVCIVEEACPAGLHHSGFSCGNHQPKIFLKYQMFRQLPAAFISGEGKRKLLKRLVFQENLWLVISAIKPCLCVCRCVEDGWSEVLCLCLTFKCQNPPEFSGLIHSRVHWI